MRVEFESAVLTARQPKKEAPAKVGWFLQTTDINSASVRYRCFHFASLLSPKFESLYFTSLPELQVALPKLDALIIVKRIDRPVVELIAAARSQNIPVFLDLCDDLLAPAYAKNEHGINLIHFLGIAPLLDGVTVPSAAMADRIEAYAGDHGVTGLSVHVVPDIAETWSIYKSTCKAITGKEPAASPTPPDPAKRFGPKQVLWFGNYGASHSNFGIFTLRHNLKALRQLHQDIPLELVVISNSETVYRALVHDCGFPTRYVPWSATATYSALAEADVALLTTGDDEFCAIKSSNRVLQALAAGVPVITSKGSALSEFEDVIFSGRTEEMLRLCLGPARSRKVEPKLQAARRLLARYQPDRIAKIWSRLLTGAIERKRRQASTAAPRKLLLVAEPGDDLKVAKAALDAAKALADFEHRLLMSIDLLEKQPEFHALALRARTTPRFFQGPLKGGRNLLLDCAALVVQRPEAPVAKQLTKSAAGLGIPVVSSASAAEGALAKLKVPRKSPPPPTSQIRAGPFPERVNADGSVEWSFIVHQNARGWILDAICREIGSRQPASWKVCYHPETSPKASNYFFSHYLLFENYIEKRPESLKGANVFVWYTHPREENPATVAKLLKAFDQVTKVVFACESNRRIWLERGLPEHKTAVVLGAADPNLFRFHERGEGVVGLSSSFYERKNPDCLLEVMKLLPHRPFVLLGRKWNQYAGFEEMRALPNFTYRNVAYQEYPAIYSTFDVFLSMSSLEGGPIPLIEAMMSNAVPVASRTGFAPDIIRHGENGFIFDVDATAPTIAQLIEQAFVLPGDIRRTVEQYDWDHFSAAVVNLAE